MYYDRFRVTRPKQVTDVFALIMRHTDLALSVLCYIGVANDKNNPR